MESDQIEEEKGKKKRGKSNTQLIGLIPFSGRPFSGPAL
jgi:hypothetical protein